ncbi:hypothetical protein M0R45_025394 [Rubus argutus]|uniref:Uncharacterized protein n=1 Tax=Rubus argutus TaxID=59490 RepID=A0AAW1WW21_RUBAR
MTSKEVKDKVRDSVERGFDKLHRITDTVTFGLAPLDGAIHGVARGVFNWLTDQHPQERTKDCKDGKNSKPGSSGGGGRGQGGRDSGDGDRPYDNIKPKGINIKGNGIRGGGSNNGNDDDEALNIEGNQISDNEADDVGISNIGNKY